MYAQAALWEYFCGKIQEREDCGQNMQRIMRLIACVLPEAITVNEEASNENEPSPEMRQLAIQVKQQIRLLIGNGMVEQAKTIIAQVKTMLPEDAELDEMEKELIG